MGFYPTRLAILLALGTTGLAIASLWLPAMTPWIAALGGFVMLGILVDILLLPRAGDIEVSRDMPSEVGVGVKFTMSVAFESGARRRLRGTFYDVLPDAMLGSREPVEVDLEPGRPASVKETFEFADRGEYALGAGGMEVRGPLGLACRLLRVNAPRTIAAIPGIELLHSNRLVLEAMKDADAGINRVRGVGRGGEFASLAPYVPGDPPQTVDWKAYARTGQLAVRRYEPERRRHVMLCCDAGRLMGGRVGNYRKVDLALESLSKLAAAALTRGDQVGLIIFDSSVQAMVPPRGGAGQLARIVRASVAAKAGYGETSYTPAFVTLNQMVSRRSLVVLATDFDNEAQGAELARNIAALRKRHVVMVCGMRDPVFHEAVSKEVSDEADAWSQLAALTLLDERQNIYHNIQHGGVHTIDSEPAHLAGPLVNLYGRIIASGAL